MSEQTRFRCAIYTRKSSEEGLDQDFNSIDAQRDAGEAYIRSQAHEGWTVVADRFDDGGFSGGNMERPALTRLMQAIVAGQVDVVVIYKIDRLTRSLTDFASLAHTFDTHKVSFVSVTQQFNTTNSMGRLMLNVLLSFAQFEREITGERIRDKIAASKKKGMWMGGTIPMGYKVQDRRLIIDDAEAAAVRQIFALYLESGHVPGLLQRLQADGITTPPRLSRNGRRRGAKQFSRGHIYKLLSNPLYIGHVRHRSTSHPGQHEAIIKVPIWTAVQSQLALNTQGARQRRIRAKPREHLLAQRLVSADGHRFNPTHASKGARRYCYYVEDVATGSVPRRLPAREIEKAVLDALQLYLKDSLQLAADLDVGPSSMQTMMTSAQSVAAQLSNPTSAACQELIDALLVEATYRDTHVELRLRRRDLRVRLGWRDADIDRPNTNIAAEDDAIIVQAPLLIKRRGRQMKLSVAGVDQQTQVSDAVLAVIAKAHHWADRVIQGSSLVDIANRDGVTAAYVSHVLHLAFLAPSVVQSIVSGRQPTDLTADQLIWRTNLPFSWKEQEAMFKHPV